LTAKLGLGACGEESTDPDTIVGITVWKGMLPRDPHRIICDTWQEAMVAPGDARALYFP